MESITYDNKKIAAILDESHWKLLVGKSPGRIGGNLLQRYVDHNVDDFTHESWEKMELFVATWTSAKNYQNDSSAASNTVVDPTVESGKSVEKGTWYRGPLERQRVQGERNSAPVWRIIQTLFKGDASTEDEYITDQNCSFKTLRKFYVDQVTVPALQSTGYGWEASRSFQRDPVTGFYNGYTEHRYQFYRLVTFPEVQDEYQKVTRWEYTGVKKDTATGLVDVDDNDAAISPVIPTIAVPDATTGIWYTVNRKQNANCTENITVEKHEPTSGQFADSSRTWTIYGETDWLDVYVNVDLASPIEVNGSLVYHYTYISASAQYQHKDVHLVRYYPTEALAIAALTATVGASASGNNYNGSGVNRVEPGLWRCTTILHTVELVSGTTVSYSDPYAELH